MPQDQATIRAEISGPVLQTYVEQGQAVKKGALLVRLDDAALRDAVLSARSAERSAKLALDNAQTDLQRQQRLEAAGAVAPRDVETAQRTVAADQAAYADAQARLTSAQQQLDKATIRSPLSGIVSDRPVNAGDVVQPGTALVTVVDPSSMRLEGSVPADQVSELRVGAPVQFSVNGYPGRSFTGRITRINPTADPATRQVRVLVSIPNAQNALVGGLFAQGRVATESRQGILAPSAAVDERGLTPTVMKIAQGKAQKVPVELGIRDPQTDEVEIRRGVSAGDTLLLGAAQGVTPGTAVHVVLGNEATTAER
jgi:RND family efflux transporter MFP subunit